MTLWHLSRAIVETAMISVPTVADSALGRVTTRACDERLDRWSRRLLDQAKIELRAYDVESLPPGETFVVMSNHQSLYDIPVVFQALGRRVRMVAKKELFHVPVWAKAMKAAGFVEVDRKNRGAAIESLKHARLALKEGTNIWIAPEGTRSRTGKLLPFKKGGFHLSLETGARILPLTIVGTRDILLAKGWTVHPGGIVELYVGEPVDPAHYGDERKDELIAEVRRRILRRMPSELQD
ncbi:MAG: lysophospholipid acyltransferase family protein [Polyangiaceae bacterium]